MRIKQSVRTVVGILIMFPFVSIYRTASVILGKQAAKKHIGRLLLTLSASMIRSLLPKIHDRSEFTVFKERLKKAYLSQRMIYDLSITSETPESIRFAIRTCPFSNALKIMRAAELCPYLCTGDFKVAAENRNRWKFRRDNSWGTTGRCCDHTYLKV